MWKPFLPSFRFDNMPSCLSFNSQLDLLYLVFFFYLSWYSRSSTCFYKGTALNQIELMRNFTLHIVYTLKNVRQNILHSMNAPRFASFKLPRRSCMLIIYHYRSWIHEYECVFLKSWLLLLWEGGRKKKIKDSCLVSAQRCIKDAQPHLTLNKGLCLHLQSTGRSRSHRVPFPLPSWLFAGLIRLDS